MSTIPKTIADLQDELNHAVRSADDYQNRADKANRALTREEQASVEDLLRQSEDLEVEIEAAKKAEALRNKVKAKVGDLIVSPPRITTPAAPIKDGVPPPAREYATVTSGYRVGKLKAFKNDSDAFDVGQFLMATFAGNRLASDYCKQRGIFNSNSEGVNSQGGVLVPTILEKTIIDLRENYGVVRQNARVRPMTSDVLDIPRKSSRVSASFYGEGVAVSETNAAFDMVKLVAKKLGVISLISSELMEDAIISIADDFANDAALAFATKEDQCAFVGDGTSTYGGIVGLSSAFTSTMAGWVTITSGHDLFSEIDATDLSLVMGKLPAYARQGQGGAKWYCSQLAHDQVFQRLAATAGGNTVQSLSGSFGPSYLGYPIVVSQALPAVATTLSGLPMLYFGNLMMSTSLGDRRGISVKASTEIKFFEDQTAIKATERIDIVNHDLGNTTTAGPLVALIGS